MRRPNPPGSTIASTRLGRSIQGFGRPMQGMRLQEKTMTPRKLSFSRTLLVYRGPVRAGSQEIRGLDREPLGPEISNSTGSSAPRCRRGRTSARHLHRCRWRSTGCSKSRYRCTGRPADSRSGCCRIPPNRDPRCTRRNPNRKCRKAAPGKFGSSCNPLKPKPRRRERREARGPRPRTFYAWLISLVPAAKLVFNEPAVGCGRVSSIARLRPLTIEVRTSDPARQGAQCLRAARPSYRLSPFLRAFRLLQYVRNAPPNPCSGTAAVRRQTQGDRNEYASRERAAG
jgi:hypothetical protein